MILVWMDQHLIISLTSRFLTTFLVLFESDRKIRSAERVVVVFTGCILVESRVVVVTGCILVKSQVVVVTGCIPSYDDSFLSQE